MDTQPERVNEVQANMDRHKNVLSRYKIRRVDFADPEAVRLKSMGWFMVNPHSNLFKFWQLVCLRLCLSAWQRSCCRTDRPFLGASCCR